MAQMDSRVQSVITLMKRDLRARLSLDDMAQSVNLTTFHFCRLFKAGTGTSPAKYLKLLRLRRAKALLETTSLTIREIVVLAGLRDESHFARDFRVAYGNTPQQHRALNSRARKRTKNAGKLERARSARK